MPGKDATQAEMRECRAPGCWHDTGHAGAHSNDPNCDGCSGCSDCAPLIEPHDATPCAVSGCARIAGHGGSHGPDPEPPPLGIRVGPAPGGQVGLAFDLQLDGLGMPPEEARELAQMLCDAAEAIDGIECRVRRMAKI